MPYLLGLLALVASGSIIGCGDAPAGSPGPEAGAAGAGGTAGGSGGCMTEVSVPNEGWVHVPIGTMVAYRHNPPASGSHYPVWARYQVFTTPIPREYTVHNLEHGAIVLLYRPDAPAATQQALMQAYNDMPLDPECAARRALMTPDPLLTDPVAVIAANFVLSGSCVDQAAIAQFVMAHRNHGPEDICVDGGYP